MKKDFAYVASAIILGVAIMMLPLALVTGLKFVPQPPFIQPSRTNGLSPQSATGNAIEKYGLARQPLNLLPTGLVLISGLVAAIVVYALFKRRIH